MNDRLAALTVLALRMHEGQVDKQGRPYSEHILAVTAAVSDEAKPVALFHDAIADLAREVKVADLRHNLGRLTPELESLRPQYEKALAALGATL